MSCPQGKAYSADFFAHKTENLDKNPKYRQSITFEKKIYIWQLL